MDLESARKPVDRPDLREFIARIARFTPAQIKEKTKELSLKHAIHCVGPADCRCVGGSLGLLNRF